MPPATHSKKKKKKHWHRNNGNNLGGTIGSISGKKVWF